MTCSEICRKPRGRQAHCSVCHRTFSGPSIFDEHRVGGNCVFKDGLSSKDGVWGHWGTARRGWWQTRKKSG